MEAIMKRVLRVYESRIAKYRQYLAAEKEYLAAAIRSKDTKAQLQIHQSEIRRLTDLMEQCRFICVGINEFEGEMNKR